MVVVAYFDEQLRNEIHRCWFEHVELHFNRLWLFEVQVQELGQGRAVIGILKPVSGFQVHVKVEYAWAPLPTVSKGLSYFLTNLLVLFLFDSWIKKLIAKFAIALTHFFLLYILTTPRIYFFVLFIDCFWFLRFHLNF